MQGRGERGFKGYLVESYGQLFPAHLVVMHQGGFRVQGVVVDALANLQAKCRALLRPT